MKIESKMTAVEWLMEEMQKTYIFNQDDFDMFKQAKEMEKQQIIDAVDYGKNHSYDYSEDNEVDYYSAEQYYNETFNNESRN
jgi:hypothetical protein